MSEKAITIYTPSDSAPHITADDDAFIYNSLLGGKSGILGAMTCTNDSAGNLVISGGGVSNLGYIMRIPRGEDVTLTVPNGTQGLNRIDTVVSQFTKGGGTASDSHIIALVKGTASENPVPSSITTGELVNMGDVNQVPLFYVQLNGVNIVGIVQAAKNLMTDDDNSPNFFVQEAQPSSPKTGDLWFW